MKKEIIAFTHTRHTHTPTHSHGRNRETEEKKNNNQKAKFNEKQLFRIFHTDFTRFEDFFVCYRQTITESTN